MAVIRRLHGLFEVVRAVLVHIVFHRDLLSVSGVHTFQCNHSACAHDVIQRSQSAHGIDNRHTSVNHQCRSEVSAFRIFIGFLARSILGLTMDTSDNFGLLACFLVNKCHTVILIVLRRIILVVLFNRIAVNRRHRLFHINVYFPRLLHHDMHRIARFVASLITEHANNCIHAIFKALDFQSILFFAIDSPLDNREVRIEDGIFIRRFNLYNRSFLVQHDKNIFPG